MRSHSHLTRLIAAVLSVAVIFAHPTALASDREHQVKTGFIYAIAKYCDWDFTKKTDNRFVVGVFRNKAFDADIDVLNGKSIHDRIVVVQKLSSESEIASCQVVIVGDVGAEAIRRIVRLSKNSGTLLIGDSEGFAQDGGAIELAIRDGKVRFDVNLQTAKSAGVTISAKLLRLADQVIR